MMTVAELITELSKCNGDDVVVLATLHDIDKAVQVTPEPTMRQTVIYANRDAPGSV